MVEANRLTHVSAFLQIGGKAACAERSTDVFPTVCTLSPSNSATHSPSRMRLI
ncbi:hypothetical protein OH687_10715 [Burkholderia anthina]|nr:hypothetical protein OH687_10715 [Burkholderia anthina]